MLWDHTYAGFTPVIVRFNGILKCKFQSENEHTLPQWQPNAANHNKAESMVKTSTPYHACKVSFTVVN
jgi:hypothetical protein